VYAMESILARASRAAWAGDIAQVYVSESIGRVALAARGVVGTLPPGQGREVTDLLIAMQSAEPVDSIGARRRIARAVLTARGDVM
jgi:hypothetical protein